MQRVAELVKAVVSMTTKGASGMTTLCWSKSVFSMAEEVPKQLVINGFKFLLFGVPKCFLGGTWGMAYAAIFILKVIINFFFSSWGLASVLCLVGGTWGMASAANFILKVKLGG